MQTFGEFVSRFGSLALSVLPWLAVGVLAAATIQAVVPERWMARLLGGRRGLAVAIATGALMPGCSRTTMPLAIGLRRMPGQRIGNLTALIFVAPLLSPITITLTWSALGWRMTVARVIASLAGAALLGGLVNRYERWFEPQPRPMPIMGAAVDDCSATGCESSESELARPPLRRLADNTLRITRRVLPYFIAGIALAALLSTVIPEDTIPKLVGGMAGPLAYLVAAVAGAPLHVCQGEEVPLTYAVLATGLGSGPALTFLLGSVGMCLPTVIMSRAILTPRVTYTYVPFWIAFTIVSGLVFQLTLH
jgi:uncharacterized membrane protein YraQ (UPF0718 family)